jgi:hypothetical protein
MDEIHSSTSFSFIKYIFRKPFKKGSRQWTIWNLPNNSPLAKKFVFLVYK